MIFTKETTPVNRKILIIKTKYNMEKVLHREIIVT